MGDEVREETAARRRKEHEERWRKAKRCLRRREGCDAALIEIELVSVSSLIVGDVL